VKTLRLILALVLLTASLVLLFWASMPNQREVRRQPIEPTQMQLPAPEGFQPGLSPTLSKVHLENQQTAKIAACFVLIL
jgi:hypothetical protein